MALDALEPRQLLSTVIAYDFDNDNKPTTVIDDSGNGNNATLPIDALGAFWEAGKTGEGMGFNTTFGPAYLTVGPALFNALSGTGSMAVWVKNSGVGSNNFWETGAIAGMEDSAGGNDIFWGTRTADGRIGFRVGDAGQINSISPINDGRWHLVVMTRDATSGAAALYVDGFLQGSATFDTGVKNSIQFQDIGRVTATGGGTFDLTDIVLDDLKVYNNVLSQNDVNALFNPGNLPPGAAPSNLTATQQAGTQVNLTWQDNSDLESYFVVERSPTGAAGTWTERARTLGTSFADATFFDQTWFYRVKAVNPAGESAYSNVANVHTDPIADQPGLMAIYYTASQTFTNGAAYSQWDLTQLNRVGFRYNDGTQNGSESGTAAVSFNWGDGSPYPNVVPVDDFYVRWEGTITVPTTANYIFRTNSDDGVRLTLDGVPIVTNGWVLRGMGAGYADASAAIPLTGGSEHYVVMEMYERGGGAGARLGWENDAGLALEAVPVSATSTAIIAPQASNLTVVGTPGPVSVNLQWTDPVNELGERVEVSEDGGTTWTVAATLKSQFTPTVSTTVTGLKPNTNYLARVVGLGAIFPDSPSGTVAFATAQVPPGSLTGSQQASTGDTNLSAEGNLDWVHWGFGGVNGYNGAAASGPGVIVGSGTTVAWSAADNAVLEGNEDGMGWEVGDSTHGQYAGQTTTAQSPRILYADATYGVAAPDTEGVATWTIYVPANGDYKLYARRKIRSNFGNDNSMRIANALDSKVGFKTFDNVIPTVASNDYGWYSQADALYTGVTAGWHTISINIREGGYVVDRIVLSTNAALDEAALNATTNSPTQPARVNGISNFTKVGSGAITAVNTTGKSFTWTGGTPTASATATTAGLATSVTGTGFEFTIPASTVLRQAKVFVAVDGTATGTLTASLSDGSVLPAFTNTLTGTGALKTAVFSFDYRSGLENQNLVVNWTKTGGTGNVILQGAEWIEAFTPNAPTSLSGTSPASATGPAVALSWTDNALNEHDFVIERSTTPGTGFAQVGTAPENATSFVDLTAAAGTQYYYRVRATNEVGLSSATNEFAVVAAAPVIGTGTGLKGAYYNDDAPPFDPATFVTVRIDPVVDFDFDAFASQRPPGFNHDNESVMWTGFVQPQATGWYTFGTASDDQSRVYLNTDPTQTQPDLSVENVSNWIYQGRTFRRGEAVFLEAGKKYAIRADFTQGGGGTNMTLYWKQPGMTGTDLVIGTGYGPDTATSNGFRVIPASQLYTPTPVAAPTAPTGVTVTALHGSNVIKFGGIDPINGQTYLVQRSTGGPFETLATLNVGNTVYVDTAVTGGTNYSYKVVATNSIGQAESSVASATAIANNLPAPYQHSDIGPTGIDPAIPGDASWDGSQYTIISGGSDIWNAADGAHMVYVKLPAVDTTVTAHVINWVATDGTSAIDQWAKIGVMIRESLDGGSRHAMSVLTQGNGGAFQSREQTNGGSSYYAGQAGTAPGYWVRLERVNNQFRAWTSPDGNTWTQMGGTATVPMTSGDQYVGLVATAHNNAMTITSTLDNLTITSAPDNLTPNAATNVTLLPTARSIAVNWTDASAQETGFKILRSTTVGGTYELIGTAPANAVSFTDTTVSTGGTYFYRVVATNTRATTQDAAAAQSAGATANPIQNVNFANFADLSQWQLNGSAAQDGNALRLTLAQNDQTGSAFYKSKLDASGFNVNFDFQVANSNGADGMTFVIQNAGLTALGGGGGSLGYAGVGSSVAIKIDFYNNISQTGLYINGAMDDAGYGTFAPIDLESGTYHMTLAYDGANLKQTIVDTTNPANKFEHTYKNVNIPGIVGGQEAYFGFSGATGGLNAYQAVQSFSYQFVQTKQNITINGTAGNDAAYIKLNAGNVEIYANATGTGTPAQSVPLANIGTFTINGGGGNDTLVIDVSGGVPIPATGLTTDGGAGDVVSVAGGSSSTNVSFNGSQLVLNGVPVATGSTVGINSATLGNLNISGGTVQILIGLLTANGVSVTGGGKLDLLTNDLLIKNGNLTDIFNLIKSARAGTPRWTGPGIGTSSANADQGLALDQVGSDVKVKFTWNGDLNLDGRVNADDYFYIDQGFLQKPTPPKYHDGDFNFDGKINADDYFLIDQAFLNQQGQVLSAPKPALAATATATKKTASRASVFSQLKVKKHARRRAAH